MYAVQPILPPHKPDLLIADRARQAHLLATASPGEVVIDQALHLFCFGHRRTCWPSEERLAHATGTSARTVRRHLKALATHGFIAIEKRPGPAGGNQYTLLAPPDNVASLAAATGRRNTDQTAPTAADKTRQPRPDKLSTATGQNASAANQDCPPNEERGTREKENDETEPARTRAAAPMTPPAVGAVVVSPEARERRPTPLPMRADADLGTRLLALGAATDPTFAAAVAKHEPAAVEVALACLEAAKNVTNPRGFVLAALERKYAAPIQFLERKAKREREKSEAVEQARETIQAIEVARAKRQDIEAEIEGQVEARQDMRRQFGRKPPLASDGLAALRVSMRGHVERMWREDFEREERELARCRQLLG